MNNIPTQWKETTLGEVVSIGRGSSPRPIQDYLSSSGIPWVKISDATASMTKFIDKTKEFIKEEGRSTSVQPGDFIVSNSATPGIPKFMHIHACVHDGWLVFSNYKELDKDYLYYFFLDYRRQLEHSASGTVFKNLTTEIVRNVPILLPPLPEQKAIADMLSSFDNKIELLREQNTTLEATAQAIFQEWFGKYNIDDELPEDWKVGKVAEFLGEFESGRRPKGGVGEIKTGVPSIGAENVKGLTTSNFSNVKFVPKDFFKSMRVGRIKDNDILVYKDGGAPGEFKPNFTIIGEGYPFLEGGINEHVFRIQTKYEYQQYYLYFWLTSRICIGQLKSIGGKAAIPGINGTDFKNLTLFIPAENILLRFHNLVKPMIKKILSNNSQIQSLSKNRDELLPRLMSGEVRISSFKNIS